MACAVVVTGTVGAVLFFSEFCRIQFHTIGFGGKTGKYDAFHWHHLFMIVVAGAMMCSIFVPIKEVKPNPPSLIFMNRVAASAMG